MQFANALPETNIAPENKAPHYERIVFQPSIFRGEHVSFREGIPPNLPPNNSLHRPPRFFQTQGTSFWRCKPLPRAAGYGIVGRGSSCVSRFASSRAGRWSVQGSPNAVSSAVTASDHLKPEKPVWCQTWFGSWFSSRAWCFQQKDTIHYKRIRILCCNSTTSKIMIEKWRLIVLFGITAHGLDPKHSHLLLILVINININIIINIIIIIITIIIWLKQIQCGVQLLLIQ